MHDLRINSQASLRAIYGIRSVTALAAVTAVTESVTAVTGAVACSATMVTVPQTSPVCLGWAFASARTREGPVGIGFNPSRESISANRRCYTVGDHETA